MKSEVLSFGSIHDSSPSSQPLFALLAFERTKVRTLVCLTLPLWLTSCAGDHLVYHHLHDQVRRVKLLFNFSLQPNKWPENASSELSKNVTQKSIWGENPKVHYCAFRAAALPTHEQHRICPEAAKAVEKGCWRYVCCLTFGKCIFQNAELVDWYILHGRAKDFSFWQIRLCFNISTVAKVIKVDSAAYQWSHEWIASVVEIYFKSWAHVCMHKWWTCSHVISPHWGDHVPQLFM